MPYDLRSATSSPETAHDQYTDVPSIGELLERPAIDVQRSRRVVGLVGHLYCLRARLIKRRSTVSAAARLR